MVRIYYITGNVNVAKLKKVGKCRTSSWSRKWLLGIEPRWGAPPLSTSECVCFLFYFREFIIHADHYTALPSPMQVYYRGPPTKLAHFAVICDRVVPNVWMFHKTQSGNTVSPEPVAGGWTNATWVRASRSGGPRQASPRIGPTATRPGRTDAGRG